MPTPVVTFRLPDHLSEWVDAYVRAHGTDRSVLIRSMIEALAEGRMFVEPRPGPNPFPADAPLLPPPKEK